MKKRIFAMLLVLSLVIAAGTVAVFAVDTATGTNEGAALLSVSTDVNDAICPCGCGRKVTEIPEDEWKDWVFNTRLETGHYRLTESKTGVTRTLISETGKVLLNLNGYSITTAAGYRGITIYGGGTATLIGEGSISAYAKGAGVVEIGASSTFNLYQAEINNINTTTSSYSNGSAVTLTKGTAENRTQFNMYSGTLNGGKIYVSTGYEASTVNLKAYCTVNMYGGTLQAGTVSSKNGLAFYLNADSELNLHGGEILGSSSNANRGGAIYMAGGTLNMHGGKISGFKAGRGGGVFINAGTFNMYGGEISGNTVTSTGHAVDVYGTSAVFTMSGGTISGEATVDIGTIHSKSAKTTISGGFVYGNIRPTAGMTLTGSPKIQEIDIQNTGTNITSAGSITIGDAGLENGAEIGITKNDGTAFVTAPAEYAQYFYGATVRSKVVAENGTLKLEAITCPQCKRDDVTWTAWTGGALSSADASGHYYLTKNVTAAGQITVGANPSDPNPAVTVNVCIDLNGYNIVKPTGTDGYRAFSVYQGSTLTLLNTSSTNSEVIGTKGNDEGGVIVLYQASNLNLYDNITLISKTVASHKGSVVSMYTGTLTMYGGTMTGNKDVAATNGGAINVAGGTVNIKGGIINGGCANLGGALYLSSGAKLNMENGTIQNGETVPCTTSVKTYHGGNIHMTGSNTTANISGGKILNGFTKGDGGNIYNASGTILNISGTALIEGGESSFTIEKSHNNNYGGGNIYSQGTLTISGGTIQDGKADDCGGNIYVRGKTTISGGKIIGGETVQGIGANISIREFDVVISGGSITGGPIDPIRTGWKSLTISGAPTISNLNVAPYTYSSVEYIPNITLGNGGVTGGSIGVTAKKCVPFTVANATLAEASKAYFHDAGNVLSVGVVDNCLILHRPDIEKECPHCNGAVATFVDIDLADNFRTVTYKGLKSNHYYLPDDYSITSRIVIDNDAANGEELNDVVINLNGNAYIKTGSEMPFWVRDTGAKLSIIDTAANGKVLSSTSAGYEGGVVRVTGGGQFDLYGGTLEYQGKGVKNAGVVFVSSSTFNMYGGKLTGGKTIKTESGTGLGGTVYVSAGTVNISGGTVDAGLATINGVADTQNKIYLVGRSAKLTIADALKSEFAGMVHAIANVNDDEMDGVGLGLTDDTWLWYPNMETLAAAYQDGDNYIRLMPKGITDININGVSDYYIDINGIDNAVVNVPSDSKIFWMDTANNDFDVMINNPDYVPGGDQPEKISDPDSCGYITADPGMTYSFAPNGKWYITVKNSDGTYSFHCLVMKLEDVNLRSAAGGVYYTAVWDGDNVLLGQLDATDGKYDPLITGYGIALVKGQLGEDLKMDDFIIKGAYTFFDNLQGLEDRFLCNTKGEDLNSCLIKNIVMTTNSAAQNEINANVVINAATFVRVKNYNGKVETIIGNPDSKSFKDIVDLAVYYAGILTGDDQTALENNLAKLYNTWCSDATDRTYQLPADFFSGLKGIADKVAQRNSSENNA